MTTRSKLTLTAVATLAVLATAVICVLDITHAHEEEVQKEAFPGDTIRCVIATDRTLSHIEFSIGFDYELLRRFVLHSGKEYLILLERDFEGCIDSLFTGSADIVVENFSEALCYTPGLLCSPAFADSTCWITAPGRRAALDSIIAWQGAFCNTPEYDSLRTLFTPAYTPSRRAATGRKFACLSPYDSLLSAKAAELGWPRTLLTALVWNESHFHIEAHSRKGAAGLMQIIPRTAKRYRISNPIDPEENLNAGVAFLKRLERIFAPYAADSDELRKFVLAAYNAGEGRLKGSLLYAASVNAPYSRWSDIVSLQPRMRKEYYGGTEALADSLAAAEDSLFMADETNATVVDTLTTADDFPSDSLSAAGISRKPLSRQSIAYVESVLATEALLRSISPTGR